MSTSAHPDLAVAVAEQVMRCTSDLGAAAAVLTIAPSSRLAVAMAGQLCTEHDIALLAGAPLTVWARGGTLNPRWREGYPVRDDSAARELEFLAALYPDPDDSTDPVARLLALRSRAEADLAG